MEVELTEAGTTWVLEHRSQGIVGEYDPDKPFKLYCIDTMCIVMDFSLAKVRSLLNIFDLQRLLPYLGDMLGALSFLIHAYDKLIKRSPKPCLEVLSFELENYIGHQNELIITIKNKSTKQITTGLRCIWFIQEEDSSEQIDSSTNRPNELENISRASKQKPAISRSKLVCNPSIHSMLNKDRNYIVIGQVSCTQLQKAVQFNLPLIQLPEQNMLDEVLGKRTRTRDF